MAYAAKIIPSTSCSGLPSRSHRSLNVPGSISSALAIRYFRRSDASSLGTKLHFWPVPNPAPPRPRSLERVTMSITSAGARVLRALRVACQPPARSYVAQSGGGGWRDHGCKRGWCGRHQGFSLRLSTRWSRVSVLRLPCRFSSARRAGA